MPRLCNLLSPPGPGASVDAPGQVGMDFARPPLGPGKGSPTVNVDWGRFLDLRAQRAAAFERKYLINLLHAWGGNVTVAARSAQLPRGTLYRLLKKHRLTADDFRS